MAAEDFLEISELFYSIQGESSFAGYPTVFIRLNGCNLCCGYCDSKYSWQETGKTCSIDDLLTFVDKYPAALVEITGGEPLLQPAVYPLMNRLLALGKTVLLETNGSISLKNVPEKIIKIMDIKTPDSGMSKEMELANIALLSSHDEIKFVLSSRQDYEWALKIIKTHIVDLTKKNLGLKAKILFSPVAGRLATQELAQWILDDQLPVRLQIQLHTVIWPDKTRGV